MYKTASLVLAIMLSIGCASEENKKTNLNTAIEGDVETTYLSMLDNQTQKRQEYQGLYNSFELSATLLTTTLAQEQLKYQAQIYQWDHQVYAKEREKLLGNLIKYTTVYMSFFTPERKYDKLENSSKSVWKAYLQSNGNRYEGTIRKDPRAVGEITKFYPFHSQFSTAYVITFTVPTSAVEENAAKFVLTGPLGSAEIDYKAINK